MNDAKTTVQRFAKALDEEDYSTVQSVLSRDCIYHCRNEQFRGKTDIIASYQSNGDMANRFDQVQYESAVVLRGNGQYCVCFTDRLTHQGRTFTFRCEQLIELDHDGLISRITHHDLPGQVEALNEFKNLL